MKSICMISSESGGSPAYSESLPMMPPEWYDFQSSLTFLGKSIGNFKPMFLLSAVNVRSYKKAPEMTERDGEQFKLGTYLTSD